MKYIPISKVNGSGIFLIDKDTGTVLGNNVVMAYIRSDIMSDVLASDSIAIDYAERYGIPLFVEQRLDG